MTGRELSIGAVARASGVGVETIRYYQRLGLLRQPERPASGPRRYGEADVARLGFIRSAQRLGFTLEEIGHLLQLEDGAHCGEAREIAEQKLRAVRDKIADLEHMAAALEGLVGACAAGAENTRCPLIGALKRNGP